ncbi:chemotaxis protein CheW [Pseudoroseomonas wenyumeiae]
MIALAALLGSPQATIPVEAGHVNAVLLRRGGRRCALAVNATRDVRTLLVDSLDVPGLDAELLSGIAPREGEAPALVLSPEGLVGRWLRDEGHLGAGTLGLEGGAAPRTAPPPPPSWWWMIPSPPGRWRRASWKRRATACCSASMGWTR